MRKRIEKRKGSGNLICVHIMTVQLTASGGTLEGGE